MISWQHPGRPVVLASQSPRRMDILAKLGFTFEVIVPPAIDEASLLDARKLSASLQKLAKIKAAGVAEQRPGALVLGADTVVVQGKKVLGKPAGPDEARSMLAALAGSRHRVYTGIALVCKDCAFCTTGIACTDVFFRRVSVDEIEAYLAHDECRDKAGAYAIQGHAMQFIEKIHGCYYNVVGLPVSETIRMFADFIRSQG